MAAGLVRQAARLLNGASSRALVAGQPIPATHPELLAEGELLPGVRAVEFAERRKAVADQLPPGGLALLPSAPLVFMAGVIPYPYRPDADLLYLTGLTQPSCVAAISSDARLTLFVPEYDSWRETWDGARVTMDAAADVFGADDVHTMGEAGSMLNKLVAGATTVVCDADATPLQSSVLRQLPALTEARSRGRLSPLRPLIHNLRWVKSPAELVLMQASASLAAGAMRECMANSHPGVQEHLLASLFEFRCKAGGASRMAYPTVTAGGPDACTIHYSRNDKAVAGDQMLLLDGGCELYGYCSDVTRTWPVGGAFSTPQRAVYEAVLEAHQQCLADCRPGHTLRELHQTSVRYLCEGLARLGVVPGKSARDYAPALYRTFYPHSVGHWLGMDTHDSNFQSHDLPLKPGVVLTIEPGLYIPDDPDRYGPYAGIGVRIEDDVAITADGHTVLSAGVPVQPDEVLALVGSAVAGSSSAGARP